MHHLHRDIYSRYARDIEVSILGPGSEHVTAGRGGPMSLDRTALEGYLREIKTEAVV